MYNNKGMFAKRRALRHNQTDAERKLWSILRNKKMLGLKFFRQYSVGSYILDFYCPESKLAIEADGGQHDEEQKGYDARRTAYLNTLNIRVLRFWNNEILQNIEGVWEKIQNTIQESDVGGAHNPSQPPLT